MNAILQIRQYIIPTSTDCVLAIYSTSVRGGRGVSKERVGHVTPTVGRLGVTGWVRAKINK